MLDQRRRRLLDLVFVRHAHLALPPSSWRRPSWRGCLGAGLRQAWPQPALAARPWQPRLALATASLRPWPPAWRSRLGFAWPASRLRRGARPSRRAGLSGAGGQSSSPESAARPASLRAGDARHRGRAVLQRLGRLVTLQPASAGVGRRRLHRRVEAGAHVGGRLLERIELLPDLGWPD